MNPRARHWWGSALNPGVNHFQNTIKTTCTKYTQKSFSDKTKIWFVSSTLAGKLSLIVQRIFQQTASFSTWTKVSGSHTSGPCPQLLFSAGNKTEMVCLYSLNPPPFPAAVFRTLVLNNACNSKLKYTAPQFLFLTPFPCSQTGKCAFT